MSTQGGPADANNHPAAWSLAICEPASAAASHQLLHHWRAGLGICHRCGGRPSPSSSQVFAKRRRSRGSLYLNSEVVGHSHDAAAAHGGRACAQRTPKLDAGGQGGLRAQACDGGDHDIPRQAAHGPPRGAQQQPHRARPHSLPQPSSHSRRQPLTYSFEYRLPSSPSRPPRASLPFSMSSSLESSLGPTQAPRRPNTVRWRVRVRL